MDVNSLEIADKGTIHLKSASGEALYDDGKPVRIIVHGPGSHAYGVIEERQTARALKRMNDNDGKPQALSAEERIAETAEDLATITIAFENLSCGKLTGQELFLAVYGNPKLGYIAKQVTKFLADWGNFRLGSSAV